MWCTSDAKIWSIIQKKKPIGRAIIESAPYGHTSHVASEKIAALDGMGVLGHQNSSFFLSPKSISMTAYWHINISPVPGDQKHHC